jgi:hypothetical protein
MVIGLTGKKQAGKNAVAKMLAVYSPLPVVEVSFAAKLKQSAAALIGCTIEDLERWKNDPHATVAVGMMIDDAIVGHYQTVRTFLQRYGTEAHREVFGEDFWLDAALPLPAFLGSEPYADGLYVVTDVRFENEAQRVRDVGGIVVRVIGPPEVEQAGDGHASEAPLPDDLVDYFLLNDRRDDDFAWLDRAVRNMVAGLVTEVLL